MKTIDQAGDLRGRRVLMRVDFDVPVGEDGNIQETFRIRKQKECLDYVRDQGAQVTLMAHITAVPSFAPLMSQLEGILGPITLKENLRATPGEEANDSTFAQELAEGYDLYINNAFAVCHRKHASVLAITKLLPSYAGLLVAEEVRRLSEVINAPVAGKIIFIGGAKVSTKMPVIQYLLDKAEVVAVGGRVANEIDVKGALSPVRLPTDVAEGALDIGPQTAQAYADLARDATLIIWNGPMGKFEDDRFAKGTKMLAEAIAASSAQSIIGGGDTIAAVGKFGIPLEKFSFVSTGGGAMLAFLAGERLPGLEALGYYAPQ